MAPAFTEAEDGDDEAELADVTIPLMVEEICRDVEARDVEIAEVICDNETCVAVLALSVDEIMVCTVVAACCALTCAPPLGETVCVCVTVTGYRVTRIVLVIVYVIPSDT